jgi:hypothetical protein
MDMSSTYSTAYLYTALNVVFRNFYGWIPVQILWKISLSKDCPVKPVLEFENCCLDFEWPINCRPFTGFQSSPSTVPFRVNLFFVLSTLYFDTEITGQRGKPRPQNGRQKGLTVFSAPKIQHCPACFMLDSGRGAWFLLIHATVKLFNS